MPEIRSYFEVRFPHFGTVDNTIFNENCQYSNNVISTKRPAGAHGETPVSYQKSLSTSHQDHSALVGMTAIDPVRTLCYSFGTINP